MYIAEFGIFADKNEWYNIQYTNHKPNYRYVMMKTTMWNFTVFLGWLFILAGMTGCKEGPTGPQGPPGANGALEGYASGIQCETCHDVATDTTYRVAAKIVQYDASVHATGGDYNQNSYQCAGCHTNEGFIERYNRGFSTETFNINAPSGPICYQGYPNATPPGCFTCHSPHQRANFTVRDSSAVKIFTLIAGQTQQSWNGSVASNLCVKCHQPRMTSTPLTSNPKSWQPDPSKINTTDTAKIYTARWNNHVSGEEAQTLLGFGGFEFQGTTFSSSQHTGLVKNGELGCEDCHMATPNGSYQNGGHTFAVKYLASGSTSPSYNVNGCNKCHTMTASASDPYWGVRTAIIGKTAQLAQLMLDTNTTKKWSLPQNGKAVSWITLGTVRTIPGDSVWSVNASTSKPLVIVPAYKAGALWNLQQIQYEKSHGIHNTAYINSLLDASIAQLTQ